MCKCFTMAFVGINQQGLEERECPVCGRVIAVSDSGNADARQRSGSKETR